MRKIASNYLFTPTGEILKHGYLLLDACSKVVDVGLLDGSHPEAHGIEFYAGLIIPGRFSVDGFGIGESIKDCITKSDYLSSKEFIGVTLINCLDWESLTIQESTMVSYIT